MEAALLSRASLFFLLLIVPGIAYAQPGPQPGLPTSGGTLTGSLTVGTSSSIAPFNLRSFFSPPSSGSAITPAFSVSGNAFGTVGSGLGAMNSILINGDTIDPSGTTGGGAYGLYVGHTLSAGAKGGRTTLGVVLNQNGATVPGANKFYVATSGFTTMSFNAGGTSGSGNSLGSAFAANVGAELKSGATFFQSVVGEEFDLDVDTGASVAYKHGISIVQTANDAVTGSLEDSAILIANQAANSSSGWNLGESFGGPEGYWPIK